MLAVDHLILSKNDQLILSELSFQVQPNVVTALIGPSGSGKTSLLRCIAGLESYQGTIQLNNLPLDGLAPEKRSLGYVEQDNTLLPHLTAADNIAYPLKLRKQAPVMIAQAVNTLAAQLQLTAVLKRYPHQLSGGEQRRVMLARTMVYQPKILLFDEPFAGVDALLRVELVRLLKQQLAALRLPVLYVTHDLAEANYIADQAIVLRAGTITAANIWAALKQQPDPWLQTFLAQHF
ncbi:MAG: ATP-binding cassette domain-containing protein [Candidatus Kerfeldbacteria bacterium]|nr:ATP-binding cassette domain-containing protein [Candidatus Kerfeldbacteria bacterium]